MFDHPLAIIGRRLAIAAHYQNAHIEQILKPFDMTGPQFALANHLVRLGNPQRISTLAAAMELQQPAISKIVRKFETEGWIKITDDQQDKRVRWVKAEPSLKTVLEEIYKHLKPDMEACFADWSEAELTSFQTCLQRLGDWYETGKNNRRGS